jgi:hypothetical protein
VVVHPNIATCHLRHRRLVRQRGAGGGSTPSTRSACRPRSTTDAASYGVDLQADPSFEEVARVPAQRLDGLRGFLADLTQDELDRVRDANPASGCPPPGNRTALECLHVPFFDAWAHHRFALRDLAIIAARS